MGKTLSVFERRPIKDFYEEVREIHLADRGPWVIGYSGGKDSTATVQVVWLALSSLPPEKRNNPVYVTQDIMVADGETTYGVLGFPSVHNHSYFDPRTTVPTS